MTDAEVIDRAVAAGWVWFPNGTPRWGKSPCWQTSDTATGASAVSCSADPASPYSRVATARRSFDHAVDCRVCGVPANAQQPEPFKAGECFECNHWMRLVRQDDPSARVVVAGTHFLAGSWSDTPPAWGTDRLNGFGGRKFVVRFTAGPNAGRTLTTFDLWHQGAIPERFRSLLPDNAVFVENTSAVQPEGGAA